MRSLIVGLAHYRLKEYPEAIAQLNIAATSPKAPYPNVSQHAYVSDLKSFAWCYLALAQRRSGNLDADAKESHRHALEAWEARKPGSYLMFDAGAVEELKAEFGK